MRWYSPSSRHRAPLRGHRRGVTSVATFGSSCDLNALRPVSIGQNSFIYAANNSILGAIPAERNRQPVPLSRISPWMPQATVAIEDRRFYQHGGIDIEGIARALWKNVNAGQVVEGGSTITQQLVRNLYISRERTVERKLKEACLAIKLNDAWSKDRILATYMNQVYYGNLAYGIEAAAQTYYSKNAVELNLPEAALLAGLRSSRARTTPSTHRDRHARRNHVLLAMLNEGYIKRDQYDWAVKRPLGLKAGKLYTTIREPYFFSFVRDQLITEYGPRRCAAAVSRSIRRSIRASSAPPGRRSRRRSTTATTRPQRHLDQSQERGDSRDDGRHAR